MALSETIRVIQTGQKRIKIFIDFWNVVINARNQCKDFDLDIRWDSLCEYVVRAAKQGHSDEAIGELAGCYIFGSVSKSNASESKFVNRTIDQYGHKPGIFFNFADRVNKQTATTCKDCGSTLKSRSESGVDVLLTVEMIKHAAMREHEYLALASSDRDFVPLLSYLRDQGQRVMHIATGHPDIEMRSATWTQINLMKYYSSITKLNHSGYIILTAPHCGNELAEALEATTVPHSEIRVIDLTNTEDISDKDLLFILSNQNLYWRNTKSENDRSLYFIDDAKKFRRQLRNGDIAGDLPYIIKDGACLISFDGRGRFRWTQHVNNTHPQGRAQKNWSKLFQQTDQ